MTVNYKEYNDQKVAFIKKHGNDWRVETSGMDEYGVYYKHYIFEDGAIWYERMAPVYRKVILSGECEGIRIEKEVEVKFMETEFFDSDNASTRKYYEKW